MIIPKEVILNIKNKLDIAGVIREYIPNLKKSGKNWISLCPFHNDRNPSMHISVDMGIFKCFSCGEGGDVIKFVEKIENISFVEAVKLLAKKAGVEVSGDFAEAGIEFKKRDELLAFNNRIASLFHFYLVKRKEGAGAKEYLLKRGITEDLINIFKIGYAPSGYNRLLNFLIKKGFTKEFLISSGLFSENERGIRSYFFNRVMFPIINHNQECVGFGGRALDPEAKPKYINSPETVLYKKTYNLYGLNITKNFIREEKKVFLVEGYVDLISCYKNGVKNVAAPCGTAITKEQISILKRYAEEIVFLMDGDEAGLKGAERAVRELGTGLIKKSVLVLPQGMDPDDYFKKYSLKDFKKLEEKRIEAFDFLVKYKIRGIDKKDYQKLTEVLNYIFEYIRVEENQIIQNSLLERMSAILEIEKGIIAREFLTYRNKNIVKREEKSSFNDKNEEKELELSEIREIDLILFLTQIDEAEVIIKRTGLREEHFGYQLTQNAYRAFFNENFSGKSKSFIDIIDDNKVKKYIEERLFSDDFKMEDTKLKNSLIDRIADVMKSYYLRKNVQINKKLKLAELYQDEELRKSLQEDKVVTIDEIRNIRLKLQELKDNDNKTH